MDSFGQMVMSMEHLSLQSILTAIRLCSSAKVKEILAEPKILSRLRILSSTLPQSSRKKLENELKGLKLELNLDNYVKKGEEWHKLCGVDSQDASEFVLFRNSPYYTVQQNFYEKHGLSAWDHFVPSAVSSSGAVVAFYADLIAAKCADVLRCSGSKDGLGRLRPRLAVVDVAAGHGVLSYLLARELLLRQRKGKLEANFTVYATDFHESVHEQTLAAAGPPLHALIASKHLAFCRLKAGAGADTEEDCAALSSHFDALHSPPRMTPSPSADADTAPVPTVVAVIANYAFDSLPCDLLITSVGRETRLVAHKHSHKEGCRRNPDTVCDHYVSMPLRGVLADSECHQDRSWLRAIDAYASDKPGVHVAPTAAASLLVHLRRAFSRDDPTSFMLIAGDCDMPHDDVRWRRRDPSPPTAPACTTDHTSPSSCTAAEVEDLPWLDPPFISPTPAAFAMPVNFDMLGVAFRYAMCSSSSPSSQHRADGLPTEHFFSRIHSAFSVGVWTISAHDNEPTLDVPLHAPRLGPSEFCVISEMLQHASDLTPGFMRSSPHTDTACIAVVAALARHSTLVGVAWFLSIQDLLIRACTVFSDPLLSQTPLPPEEEVLQLCVEGLARPVGELDSWWTDAICLRTTEFKGARVAVLRWLERLVALTPRGPWRHRRLSYAYTIIDNMCCVKGEGNHQIARKRQLLDVVSFWHFLSPLEALAAAALWVRGGMEEHVRARAVLQAMEDPSSDSLHHINVDISGRCLGRYMTLRKEDKAILKRVRRLRARLAALS